MKTFLSFLLSLPLIVQSAELLPAKNVELARTLSFFEELAHRDGIRIFAVPVAAAECWGTVESCPDVKLFIVVSPEALYQDPTLYQLPTSKGWKFVRWEKSGSFVLRTALPDSNIKPVERAQWRSVEYLVEISGKGASYSIIEKTESR